MDKFGIELKWAAIISVGYVGWAIIEKSIGWHKDFSYHLVSFLLFFVALWIFYLLAYRDKRKNYYNNSWSVKDAFKFGLFITGLLAILNPLIQTIIYQSISPDYFDNIIQYKIQQKSNQMTAVELAEQFNLQTFIRNGIFDILSCGVIYSIGLAYLLKTKDYTPPQVVKNNKNKKK